MIVVSHRGPYSFVRESDGSFGARRGAGGVVSALSPLLARLGDDERALWVAAAIGDDDRAAVRAGAARAPGIDLALLDLDEAQHRLHYDVVSNSILWFLHHGLFDLPRRPRFDARFREAWDAYVAVNERFAECVAEHARAGEAVLVQDYQLALVPGMLRDRRPDVPVVHFTHTPFCGPTSIRVLPDDVASALCSSMASGPAGFHTRRWAAAFAASAREVLGEGAGDPTFSASFGPDVDDLSATAASPETAEAAAALDELVGDRLMIFRTDRIEPSKNIVRGFAAFDVLLEERPEWRRRVVFVASIYPSRQGLAEYLAYANEVDQAAARVNDRWGSGDWTPVVVDAEDAFPRSVAGLLRYDALLVNPIRDGLNLVAKEGPALNRRDGVLCLSREAGAFDEMGDGAVAVHPYDLLQTAGALHEALSMPAGERAGRAVRLAERAVARTPAMWLDDQLARIDAP